MIPSILSSIRVPAEHSKSPEKSPKPFPPSRKPCKILPLMATPPNRPLPASASGRCRLKWRVVTWILTVLVFAAMSPFVFATETFPLPPTLLDNAVFTCSDATVTGNAVVDSVDLAAGGIRGEEGHIVSNGDVTLDGTVEIHGDVTFGPGFEVILNGTPLITGTVGEAVSATDCHPNDLDALAADLETTNDNDTIPRTEGNKDPLKGPNNRDLKITGNDTLVLPSGTYLLDSISLTGGARIDLDGPVRILCLGDVSKVLGGSSLNSGGQPSDLRLFVGGTRFKLQSNGVIHAFVYAPNAQAKIGGGALFVGGLFADSLDLNGGARLSRGLDDRDPPLVTLDEPAADCLPAGVLHTLTGTYSDENPADSGAVILTVIRSDGDTVVANGLLAGDGIWIAPDIDLGMTDGQAHLTITAVDAYQNSTVLEHTWRIDAGTPFVTLLADGIPVPSQNPGLTPPPG
ncbi:MAG: hypothetical protein DRJ61_14960, partial [Acidobacteria bacterium]